MKSGGQPRKAYAQPGIKALGRLHLQTQGTGGDIGDGMTGMAMAPSDARVKENIVRIGMHPIGVGLYLFDYKPEFQGAFGTGRRWGVMADEIEAVIPEAVHVGTDGYKRVDYSMLGMELASH